MLNCKVSRSIIIISHVFFARCCFIDFLPQVMIELSLHNLTHSSFLMIVVSLCCFNDTFLGLEEILRGSCLSVVWTSLRSSLLVLPCLPFVSLDLIHCMISSFSAAYFLILYLSCVVVSCFSTPYSLFKRETPAVTVPTEQIFYTTQYPHCLIDFL